MIVAEKDESRVRKRFGAVSSSGTAATAAHRSLEASVRHVAAVHPAQRAHLQLPALPRDAAARWTRN